MEDIAEYMEMGELLSRCQIISIHVDLNPGTRNLVGREELELMREDAILVNTSRGEILDLKALSDILGKGRLRGVGLDNYPGEPAPDLSALLPFERVVMTPHIAFNTREAKNRMTSIAVDNVVAFYRGEPRNVMNPAVL